MMRYRMRGRPIDASGDVLAGYSHGEEFDAEFDESVAQNLLATGAIEVVDGESAGEAVSEPEPAPEPTPDPGPESEPAPESAPEPEPEPDPSPPSPWEQDRADG